MTPKQKSELDAVIAECRKEYGDRSVSRLGDRSVIETPSISTGSLSLDLAIGCGGFPRGRISEIFGPESGGKTTMCLQAIARAQRDNLEAVFIDAENALNPDWARRLGVSTDRLILVQPDSGEQAFDVLDRFVNAGVGIVVVDSVAGLIPRAELQGDYGDSAMGLHAKLMSQACRKLSGLVSKTQTAVVFINQTRDKIGIVYGNPTVTTGGRALTFWASVRVEVRRAAPIKEGEQEVGVVTKAKIVKNKLAPPHRVAEFDLYYGSCPCHGPGVDGEGDLINMALNLGVMDKAGSWFRIGEENLAQGRTGAAKRLREQPEIRQKIEREVLRIVTQGAR